MADPGSGFFHAGSRGYKRLNPDLGTGSFKLQTSENVLKFTRKKLLKMISKKKLCEFDRDKK
jgi:hypothetical protein